MPDILLATLNARYAHAAFGLRYLLANLGELRPRAAIREFDISQRPLDIAEAILAEHPRILGLGIYIWNVAPSTELVAALKRIQPELIVVLGGPEISFETDQQPIAHLADHIITGEADRAFADLCRTLLRAGADTRPDDGTPHPNPLPQGARDFHVASPLEGEAGVIPTSDVGMATGEGYAGSDPSLAAASPPHTLAAPLPDFSELALPYDYYTDEDLAHRVTYVEASRGCPFACEFCLSSLDIPVRNAPLEPFLAAMQQLLDRGLRQFKFVDRTFNLNLKISRAILEFFLARYQPGLFVHFELIPDRLPEPLRAVIREFPAGALQFEVGIQTFNETVATRISRRQDNAQTEANLRWLREETGVHVHADLIVGLPGESLESFAAGFDRLVALRPHEIQVGMLKRLRGTPIVRHDTEWSMVYAAHPPYEILQNKLLDFATMQRLRRFARFWDLVANSGRFAQTAPLIWQGVDSPFRGFLTFADWLYQQVGRTHSIALPRLQRLLSDFLMNERKLAAHIVQTALDRDAARPGATASSENANPPRRQARHLAAPAPFP